MKEKGRMEELKEGRWREGNGSIGVGRLKKNGGVRKGVMTEGAMGV